MVLTFSESEIFFDEPFYRRTTERKKGRTSGSESDGGGGGEVLERTESGYLSIKVISASSQDTNELMCKNELMTVQDCTLKRDK